MDRNSVNWHGSVCAVVTPFTETGELDLAAYDRNVELILADGAHAVVVTGCTGEAWALTPEEKTKLARRTVAIVERRVPVIAGTTVIRPHEVIEQSEAVIAAGVDGVMVSAPYDCLPREHEIYEYFKMISNALCFPLLVYNIPSRVGVNLSMPLLDKLADLESVVAVKQSSPEFMDVFQTLRTVGDRLRVIVGYSGSRGLASVALGVDGFTSTSDLQVIGHRAVELYEASVNCDMERARQLQELCYRVSSAVTAAGPLPAAIKGAMNLVGRPGGYPRRPLLPVSGERLEKLRQDLTQAGLNLAGR